MAAVENKKRKRGADPCRITYLAPDGRIFERLFKEGSLEETKGTVRGKLGLPVHTPISLTQLREGKAIELEDDDDFESFQILTKSASSVEIRVTVGDGPRTQALRLPDEPTDETSGLQKPRKRRKNKKKDISRSLSHLPTPSITSEKSHDDRAVAPPVNLGASTSLAVPPFVPNTADEPVDEQPKKKKQKRDHQSTTDVQHFGDSSTLTPAGVGEGKAGRKKQKSEAAKAIKSAAATPIAGPSTPAAISAKPKSAVGVPAMAEEEAAPPKKKGRKSKQQAVEEPPPPDAVGDSADLNGKKNKKSKQVQEVSTRQGGVGTSTVPVLLADEPAPAPAEKNKRNKKSKDVEGDARRTGVRPEPTPASRALQSGVAAAPVAEAKRKTKKSKSKEAGEEPTSRLTESIPLTAPLKQSTPSASVAVDAKKKSKSKVQELTTDPVPSSPFSAVARRIALDIA
ncbi:hypothetical protein OE88DRAFT_1151618 [Heliocybe sulcata]|uniref:Uncharacterized protein n=1 Tax=Heliocybe sulcata TaxID=5364 RepID=A0A5C3NAQ0_9AGAM|nr:hypothetical protein OE88DRAFT_1151618 [Heliocybe sulcata]